MLLVKRLVNAAVVCSGAGPVTSLRRVASTSLSLPLSEHPVNLMLVEPPVSYQRRGSKPGLAFVSELL